MQSLNVRRVSGPSENISVDEKKAAIADEK